MQFPLDQCSQRSVVLLVESVLLSGVADKSVGNSIRNSVAYIRGMPQSVTFI